jgi:hypothetical protein
MTVPAMPARFSVAENVGGEETLLFGSQFKSPFETDSVQSILCPLYSLFSGGEGVRKEKQHLLQHFRRLFLVSFHPGTLQSATQTTSTTTEANSNGIV